MKPFIGSVNVCEFKSGDLPGEEADEVLILCVLHIESEILELIWKPRVHRP